MYQVIILFLTLFMF